MRIPGALVGRGKRAQSAGGSCQHWVGPPHAPGDSQRLILAGCAFSIEVEPVARGKVGPDSDGYQLPVSAVSKQEDEL